MPLFIAPALADRTPQAMLLLHVVNTGRLPLRRSTEKKNTGLQLEMRKRPERRKGRHAELPNMLFCDVAEHRGTLVSLLTPRDFLPY